MPVGGTIILLYKTYIAKGKIIFVCHLYVIVKTNQVNVCVCVCVCACVRVCVPQITNGLCCETVAD